MREYRPGKKQRGEENRTAQSGSSAPGKRRRYCSRLFSCVVGRFKPLPPRASCEKQKKQVNETQTRAPELPNTSPLPLVRRLPHKNTAFPNSSFLVPPKSPPAIPLYPKHLEILSVITTVRRRRTEPATAEGGQHTPALTGAARTAPAPAEPFYRQHCPPAFLPGNGLLTAAHSAPSTVPTCSSPRSGAEGRGTCPDLSGNHSPDGI